MIGDASRSAAASQVSDTVQASQGDHLQRLRLILSALLLCLSAASSAQPPNAALQRGEQVAQTVHGILGYARWPQPRESLRLCVLGPTQYADVLLASQAAEDQRPVEVQRYLLDTPQLENQCEAVYMGILDEKQRLQLLSRLTGQPILSISESSDACSDGSLFCLRIGDDSTSFAVNLDAVARSGIRIHPQVLQLGRRGKAQP